MNKFKEFHLYEKLMSKKKIKVNNLIVKRKNNSSFDLIKKDYLINDEKIIFKYEEKYRIKLLIGYFD
jgi:hypothetical protein